MFIKKLSCNPLLVQLLLLNLVFVFIYFLQNPGNIKFPFLSTQSQSEFKLLVGIHTIAKKYERRHLIRMAYAVQQPVQNAQVDIRFVLCNITSDEERVFVSLEIMTYRDIIIIDCIEKPDTGKTYTYFSSLPRMFSRELRPYDYVMKTDDDTYLRLDQVVESLRNKSRTDAYWGTGLPVFNEESPSFMLGMGYIVSWDLVEWISTSEIPRDEPIGNEDMLTGDWLNKGGKANNRYNMYPRMYDFEMDEAKQASPDSIAVHQLKPNKRWVMTFERFNVTQRLEPSPFYHF